MKIPCQIIADLSRAHGEGAQLGGGEINLEVPSVVQPIVSLCHTETPWPTFLAGAIQRKSFLFGLVTDRPPSTGGSTQTVCTFGKGLWEIDVYLAMNTDFNGSITDAEATKVTMRDDLGTHVQEILVARKVASTPQQYSRTMTFLFATDGWTIKVQDNGTGVAQNMTFLVSVHGRRLI